LEQLADKVKKFDEKPRAEAKRSAFYKQLESDSKLEAATAFLLKQKLTSPEIAKVFEDLEPNSILKILKSISHEPDQFFSSLDPIKRRILGIPLIKYQNDLNALMDKDVFQTFKIDALDGKIERRIGKWAGGWHIWFKDAFLFNHGARAPSFIQVHGVKPLVKDRGVPLQLFATLQQMKMAGVPYGGLRTAETSIGNARTLIELWQSAPVQKFVALHPKSRVPDKLLKEAFLSTHSGQYMETVFTQSGHKITDITLSGTNPWSFEACLNHARASGDIDTVQRLLETGPRLDENALFPTRLDVNFKLEPITPPHR
jgi:hypothetical protein